MKKQENTGDVAPGQISIFDDVERDEHCCSAHDDGNGYCEVCGAVIPGTWAYFETYGGEPPERPTYHWTDL